MSERDLISDKEVADRISYLRSFFPSDHSEHEHVGQPYWPEATRALDHFDALRELQACRAALRKVAALRYFEDRQGTHHFNQAQIKDLRVEARACLPGERDD